MSGVRHRSGTGPLRRKDPFDYKEAFEQERVDVSLAGFLYGVGIGVAIGVALANFFA